jgi:hypothetical protein
MSIKVTINGRKYSFDSMDDAIEKLGDKLDGVFDGTSKRFDKAFDGMSEGFDKAFDGMSEGLDKVFDRMDKSFDSVDRTFDKLDKAFSSKKKDVKTDTHTIIKNESMKRMQALKVLMVATLFCFIAFLGLILWAMNDSSSPKEQTQIVETIEKTEQGEGNAL